MLNIRGRVLPSTLAQIRLWAERADGEAVCGETSITGGRGACRRVWLEPEPRAHPPALEAIAQADLVLLGPGSLFTSVLPHLAVPELAEAVARAPGRRAYVCNVMTQPGETDGFDAADHVERVLEAVPGGLDLVVVHEGPLDPAVAATYAAQGQEPVAIDAERLQALGVGVVTGDIAEAHPVVRHAPEALAQILVRMVEDAARR